MLHLHVKMLLQQLIFNYFFFGRLYWVFSFYSETFCSCRSQMEPQLFSIYYCLIILNLILLHWQEMDQACQNLEDLYCIVQRHHANILLES